MRLRVGVIGLGRRWRRYRPILAHLRQYIEVRAVCDQIAHRAALEARRLGCAPALGPVELLERPDVDAMLLLDAQWFGLWPIEYSCTVNKPVFCAMSPERDDAHADAIQQRTQQSGLPVFVAMPTLLLPAAVQLRELLAHRLGQARLVRAEWCAAEAANPRDLLRHPMVLALLAGCAWLLDDVPRSVWTIGGDGASFVTLVLRFGVDRLAQVTLWSAAVGRPSPRLELVAESGTAAAVLPRRLRWRDRDGQHSRRLPPRSLEQCALERFLLALRAGQPLQPNFTDAYRALTWLRAARRSRGEGRRIDCGEPCPLADPRGSDHSAANR